MTEFKQSSKRPIIIAILVGSLLIAVGLAVGLALGLRDDNDDNDNRDNNMSSDEHGGGSAAESEHKSHTGYYKYASVVADSEVASQIGNEILARHGGNAVDAAVATALATGVVSVHSAGIGGGGFIIMYDSESEEWHAIDTRETAPAAATADMFVDDIFAAYWGGLAVGVPGEVMGLYEMHQRFGRLPWSELVQPTIDLCQQGVPITSAVNTALASSYYTEELKQLLRDTGYLDEDLNPMPVGTLVHLPKLAATFQTLAQDPMSFYTGSLAQDIADDLADGGAILTLDDIQQYSTKWTQPSRLDLPGNLSILSMPAPGSGPVINYILSTLAGYGFSPMSVSSMEDETLTYHRFIEAVKFAYAKKTELGDEDFVDVAEHQANMSSLAYGEWTREQIDDDMTHEAGHYHPAYATMDDPGTTHLSVLDAQGSAVSITTSINGYFGSYIKGSRTGIFFNNIMGDFSTPNRTSSSGLRPSPSNFIEPGKRPQSSMTPVIVWDGERQAVRMVTGAAGGSRITTTVAMNIMDVLWFNRTLPDSVDRPRMHNAFLPPTVQVEEDFPNDIKIGLEAKGHELGSFSGITVVQAIDANQDQIVGTADFRKGGSPDGY